MRAATITQADRDWWADYLADIYGQTHPDIIAIRAGQRDDAKALAMVARHRIACSTTEASS